MLPAWKPCHLHDLTHVSWVGYVLYRSTAYHIGWYKDLADLDPDLYDLSVDDLPDVGGKQRSEQPTPSSKKHSSKYNTLGHKVPAVFFVHTGQTKTNVWKRDKIGWSKNISNEKNSQANEVYSNRDKTAGGGGGICPPPPFPIDGRQNFETERGD